MKQSNFLIYFISLSLIERTLQLRKQLPFFPQTITISYFLKISIFSVFLTNLKPHNFNSNHFWQSYSYHKLTSKIFHLKIYNLKRKIIITHHSKTILSSPQNLLSHSLPNQILEEFKNAVSLRNKELHGCSLTRFTGTGV